MGHRKISEISTRELLVIGVPTLMITLLVFGIAYHYVLPEPPRTVVLTTGMEGGSYAFFGERYRQILARDQVTLELQSSSGSVENLKRLMDKSFPVDVGFVQGGTSYSAEAANLVSLGAIGYTPFWVFYRSVETYDDLSQLKGKRMSIGPEGSGVRKFALDLLKAARAADPPTLLLDLTVTAAAQALIDRRSGCPDHNRNSRQCPGAKTALCSRHKADEFQPGGGLFASLPRAVSRGFAERHLGSGEEDSGLGYPFAVAHHQSRHSG